MLLPRGHLAKLLAAATLLHGSASASLFSGTAQEVFSSSTGGIRGAVASEADECSLIGRDLLTHGGNAVDALVGTTFCVGTVAMYHSGIGGGGFALIRDSDGNYEAVDFRESAPAAAFEDMYRGNINGSIFGGLAAGVPGEVRGLEYIHQKYGNLPWKTVMRGAIDVARYGFKVSGDLVHFIDAMAANGLDFLTEDPSFAEDFAPNGTLVKKGDVMTRKRLANTLERIAEEGSSAFYSGDIARSMIAVIQDTNGTMTLEDLASYEVKSRKVSRTTYRGIELYGISSPAGGAVSLSNLKTMAQYASHDLAADGNLTVHRFDEAMRFAYGARMELGDPDFVPYVENLEAEMLDEKHAKLIKDRILDNQTQAVESYNPKRIYTTDGHGTSHIVTADGAGMATSLTTTINLIFGAQIMDPDSGVIINNEMNDFSIPGVPNEFGFRPSAANFIRPYKRPLSSCTPLMAARPDGSLLASVGAAGGSRIISSTAQVLWHVLERELSMKEALAEPRIHDQLVPNIVTVEFAFDNATVESLLEKGHEVRRVGPGGSSVQGIRRLEDGVFEAAAEPRRENSGAYTV